MNLVRSLLLFLRRSACIPRHSAGLAFALLLLALAGPPRLFAQRDIYPKGPKQEQPLHTGYLPSWLSFDSELRGRTENQSSLNFVPGKQRLYELTRVYGGMRVAPTSWFTGYFQFHDTHALGLPVRDTNSSMRDYFDLFQGYLELHHGPARLFAGRQLLSFADERVLGISDWNNNSRSWDGFDLRLGDRNRVDFFTAGLVKITPESLDKHGDGLTYHGIEGQITTWAPHTTLSPFVLVKAMPYVTGQQGIAGTETEVTPGIFFFSKLPLHFEASGTADVQRGSYANDSIHAGAAILRGAYTLSPVRWQPQLQAEYDYATGNPHTNPGRISTYDQQYPSNHNAFGLVDLFGFENLKQRRLGIALAPGKTVSLLFQTGSLHLASTRDGVYAGAGTSIFKAPAAGFRGDDAGTEFDASGKYTWHKYFLAQVGVGHFFPGTVMTEANHGAPLTLAYLSLTYRFSLQHPLK